MHGLIRDRLEGLLGAERTDADNDGTNHLSSCSECSTDLQKMKAQSEMLRLLRVSEDLDPSPGFYSRVVGCIEQRAKNSIWSVFIYSHFANRLVYASLTVALALGSYVITQESRDGHLAGGQTLAENVHYDAPVTGDQDQQRNAVLANFAVH